MNPLIRREFFGILRSPKAMGMLLALTLVFSVAVLMRWPSDPTAVSGTQSMQVFRIFGYGLLAGVVFLVPAFPATSIVNEKNNKTLALLLNSPLSAFSIYFGKMSGVLLFSFLVLLCSLPASAACYAMGGIAAGSQLGMLYLILALLILQYTTLGMLISSYVQTSDSGVRLTYAFVLGMLLLTLLPYAMIQGIPTLPSAVTTIAGWIRNLSPLPAVMEVMGQNEVGSTGLKQSSTLYGFLIMTVLTSCAFAAKTLNRLNYRIFDQSRAKGVVTNELGAGTQFLRRIFYIVDPNRRKAGTPWYMNPVMVKEFRCRKFGRGQWLLRLVAGCAVVAMVLTFLATNGMVAWGVDGNVAMLVLLQVILVVALTPSLASGLISGERDSGGWELLRMTPLSTFRIVFGKLLSVIWTLLIVLMATLPSYVIVMLIKPELSLQVQLVLVCLLWTVIYALAVSSAVGSLFRYTAVSTAVTYVVVVGLFVIPILVWLGRDAPFGHDTVQAALMMNPVGAALSVINAPGFESYDLLPVSWWVAAVVSTVMFAVLGVQVWRLTRAV